MKQIRLHGRGGQGTVMAAEMLADALVLGGRYASAFPSFGIERRGSAVQAFARYSGEYIREKTQVYKPDILMVLEPTLIGKGMFGGFRDGGVVIACSGSADPILAHARPSRIALVDGLEIADEVAGNDITNIVILGAFAKTMGEDIELFKKAVKDSFRGAALEKNLICLQRGYDETKILDYDVEVAQEEEKCLFLEEKTSCNEPPAMRYETSWSDCTDRFAVINTGAWRSTRPVLDVGMCVQCGRCAVYCPLNCIHKNEEGYYKPSLDYCKGCGICANDCPMDAITMVREEK